MDRLMRKFIITFFVSIWALTAAAQVTPIVPGQAGGTVRPKLNNVLNQVINVKQPPFNAVGDGLVDDTTAIQAAVDWNMVTLATSAGASAGTSVLTFASVPSSIVVGQNINVYNVNHPTSIPTPSLVTGVTATTVTINTTVAAPGVSSGDSIQFRFPNLGKIFFPAGTYKITAPITFNFDGELSFILEGVGTASTITGNFNGYLFDRSNTNPTSGVRVLRDLKLNNDHATGGGIRLLGTVGGSIEDVNINAYRAITLTNGNSWQVLNAKLISSNAAGSWGIMASNAVSIVNADIQSYENGIRHSNIGLQVIGGRIEVCTVGILLGKDSSGGSDQSTAAFIAGVSMEANQTGIHIFNATNFEITSTSIGGGVSMSRGLYLQGASFGKITGLSVGSGISYSGGAIDASGSNGAVAFETTNAAPAAGTAWVLPSNPFNITATNSNNPTLASTFANLPASPVEGMEYNITDGTDGLAWGATATNTGTHTTHYKVRYNGSNWTVVGK